MTGNERIFPSREARFSSPTLGLSSRPSSAPPSSSRRALSPRSLLAHSVLPTPSPPGMQHLPLAPPNGAYDPLRGFQPAFAYREHQAIGPASYTGSVSDGESSDPHAAPYSAEEDDDSPGSHLTMFKTELEDVQDGARPVPKKRRRERKERKPTHLVRREEKLALEQQIHALEGQLESLKTQALVNRSLHVKEKTQAPVMNRILRESVQARQVAVADVQGMLSCYVREQHDISPVNALIRLSHDRDERHETLLAMKAARLEAAKNFLDHRCRGLDLTRLYSEVERFETDRGDYCSMQFDVTQFHSAPSVRIVFDAMLQQTYNVEISISEMLGNITIREDDDSGADGIQQYRLVASNTNSRPMETNSIQFSEFREATSHGGGYESGLIVGDFVDNDDLYPYRPNERLRRDVTAAIEVTRLPLSTSSSVKKVDEFMVVVKRWSLVKLHHSDLPMTREMVQQARNEIGRWADDVIRAMQDTLAR